MFSYWTSTAFVLSKEKQEDKLKKKSKYYFSSPCNSGT